MKTISLWQPWASLIAVGAKRYETRSWRPPARLLGQRIAIHAALKPVDKALSGVSAKDKATMLRALDTLGGRRWYELPLGAIVCTAILDAVYEVSEIDGKVFWCGEKPDGRWLYLDPMPDPFGDYSIGRFVWKLTNVQTFPQSPSRLRYEARKRAAAKELGLFEKITTMWPAILPLEGPLRPLKIGIAQDLITAFLANEPVSRPVLIRVALTAWFEARAKDYLTALAAGGSRIGLDGLPAGDISPKEQRRAAKALARLGA